MKHFTQITLSFLCSLLFFCPLQTYAACPVTGPANVCENQTSAYSTPSNPGETYTWNATGGGTVIGSGNSISVAWTSIGTGSVTLIVKNALNVVVCTNVVNVVIHGKPNPVISPSFISACGGGRKGNQGKEGETCLVACDSTSISYSTPNHPGSTYVWTVTGAANYSSSGNVVNVFWTGIGTGSIKVTETNAWGCSRQVEKCVEIVGKPKAAFTTLPGLTGLVVYACKGQVIQFLDQSTAGVGSPINSWSWYFGDGGTDFQAAPGSGNTSHSYASGGTYTAMLVVENQCKCKDTAYVTIDVSDDPGPEIFCISTVCPDATVTYTTNASTCNNYLWTVTNGSIVGSNTDSTVTIQWGSNGPGSITLSVNCPGFCNSPTTVFVPIITPNATISGPSQVCQNGCYTYHISCDIPVDSIIWHFPPGVSVTTDSVNVHEVQVCYYVSSPFTGVITADYYHTTNGSNPPLSCGGRSRIQVSVKPEMFVGGPASICENQTYNYSVSPAPAGNIYWTITDISGGTTYVSNTLPTSSSFAGTWTYGPGQFIVTANDMSGNYCNAPVKKTLVVNPKPPLVDTLLGPNPVCPNNSYVYTAIPSSSNYFVAWQVTNGTPSTGIGNTLSITWGPSGPYIIDAVQIDPVTGCKSGQVTMNVNSALPLGVTPITGSDTVCSNSNENYSTNVIGDDFSWSINPAIAGSVSSGQHSNSISVQWNNYIGNAWLVIKRTACGFNRKDSILINVGYPPVPVINIPPTACQGTAMTASSSSPAASYAWTFGDAGTGSGNPAQHTYNTPGNYVITLTATYTGACPGTASNTASISVLPKPNINISTPDPNAFCSAPVSTAMYVAAPAIGTTYQWYNTAGPISGAVNPSYTATTPSNYYVIGTNSYGCSDTSNIIPVQIIPCAPCTAAPYTLDYNRFRLGCNKDSFAAVTSAGVINLSWSFDDPFNPGGASGTPVTHTFTEPGYYRVKICADVPNASGTGYCNVCMYKVDTIKYIPNFYDSTYCVNYADSVKVKFVNTTKILTGYPVPSWSWLINPGGYTSTTKNPVKNLAPGTYSVSLTVGGICTITKNIVIPALPNASFTIQDSFCQGQPVIFTNTSTGASLSSSWTFGDGSSSLISSPIRTYTNAGAYLVTLQVINNLGCKDTALKNVVVLPNTLTGLITAGGPLKFCEGDSVKLSVNPSGGYPGYNYLWTTTETSQFIWAKQTGNYHVEITDSKGCFYMTSNKNVLAKTKPRPTILGPETVCENNNYIYTANYPNFGGSVFNWTVDGLPQPYVGNQLYLGMYGLSMGSHQIIVSVNSPDTCYGSDTLDFTLHPNPNVSIIAGPALCAGTNNMIVATSTSTNLTGFYWDNGQVNDTIYSGIPKLYTVTVIDTFGCKAQASTVVNPLPDLCGLMTGCYEICDSVTQLVWYAPPGYAAYQWYFNNTMIPWAVSDTIHIPLYQAGSYTVSITSNANCSVMSDPIKIDFVKCGGCRFNAQWKIKCGPVSPAGNQTYNLTFSVNNTLGAGANISISSPNGVISSLSPGTLAAGVNTITAVFEDTPPVNGSACFNLVIYNKKQKCDTTICMKLPVCGSKDCKLSTKITKFDCAGHDGSGNPQYYVCMNVTWGGSNGSTYTITSPAGTFTPNPVTINNGTQSLCYTFTDLPPANSFMTIYTYAFDPIKETTCKDSFKWEYKPCKDSCILGIYGECAHCHKHDGGTWNYDIDLTVFNPFAGNATVSILPIAAGTFGPITPNPVGPGMQIITSDFTDIAPANSIICFKVLLTEIKTGKTCWKEICIYLPPCDSMTSIMVNTVESYSMTVYPNPTSDVAKINYRFEDASAQIEFVMTDVNGREINRKQAENNSGETQMNTSDLDQGIYFIKVIKDGRVVGTTKLTVLRN
jgi:PKD repeat protein